MGSFPQGFEPDGRPIGLRQRVVYQRVAPKASLPQGFEPDGVDGGHAEGLRGRARCRKGSCLSVAHLSPLRLMLCVYVASVVGTFARVPLGGANIVPPNLCGSKGLHHAYPQCPQCSHVCTLHNYVYASRDCFIESPPFKTQQQVHILYVNVAPPPLLSKQFLI